MAKPSTTDIEALYARAEAGGLGRDEADTVAAPALGTALGGRPITSLADALSGADLRRAAVLVDGEIRSRRPRAPRAAGLALQSDVRWALTRRHEAGLPPLGDWGHLYGTASGTPNGRKIAAARLTEEQACEVIAAARASA